jgi:hypothetical protein
MYYVIGKYKQNLQSGYGSASVPLHLPNRIMNASIFGEVLVVAILIFFVSALIGPTANASTGITIPHTGFTVNPNITASPGLVPLTQLLPFLLVAVAFFGGLALFEKHAGNF